MARPLHSSSLEEMNEFSHASLLDIVIDEVMQKYIIPDNVHIMSHLAYFFLKLYIQWMFSFLIFRGVPGLQLPEPSNGKQSQNIIKLINHCAKFTTKAP